MPEDWVGHPLRKDYDVGTDPRPVQGSELMTRHGSDTDDGVRAQTSEGDQEMKPRSETDRRELMREVGVGAAHERGRGRPSSATSPRTPTKTRR